MFCFNIRTAISLALNTLTTGISESGYEFASICKQ